MWDRKIKQSRTQYGRVIPRRVETRSMPCMGVNVLIKVMETGEVELSMNGTAQFANKEYFAEFLNQAASEVWTAGWLLDNHPLV